MIWKHEVTIEMLNAFNKNMSKYLEIEFTEIGSDYLIAKMPVNEKTMQPFGLLHGGASVVLAETLGSVASNLCIEDMTSEAVVGIEINANHLNGARNGFVYGKVSPLKLGRKIHVWQIDIHDNNNKPICSSRLTTTVIKRKTS